MIERIAIIGPESSGKTTLAKAISDFLGWRLIDEYARDYFQNQDYSKCSLDDLIEIAQNQFLLSHNIEQNKYLVSDTEMITMEIWALDKFGIVPEIITELRKSQTFDLYILCKPDMPWQKDALRTDENRRHLIYKEYQKVISKSSARYIELGGTHIERMIAFIDYLNKNKYEN